eukprot:Skav232492  [mRNA]  locus=scaffold3757:51129:64994:+ [translate_table: standard]
MPPRRRSGSSVGAESEGGDSVSPAVSGAVLTDKLVADLLLKADESDKKAFSHWSKFQILIQSSEGIRWLYDGHSNGWLSSEKLSTRNLQAITCQAVLAQKSVMQLILEKIDADYPEWPPQVKQEACFGAGHWSTMVSLVKNRRAIGDFLSAPSLSAELADIDEKYAGEVKEKKKQLKKAAGEQHQEEEVAQEDPVEEETPETVELPHMLIGHHNQLTTLKSGEDAVQKNEKVLTVIYSEESISKRKERNKTMGAIKQTENIYMLMPPSGCRVMKKQRTVKEKRELFGKHRIAVGGALPPEASAADSEFASGRKSDTSKEPVFFHSGPYSLDEELANALTQRLEAQVFQAMQDTKIINESIMTAKHSKALQPPSCHHQEPSDPLFNHELTKLIKDSKALKKEDQAAQKHLGFNQHCHDSCQAEPKAKPKPGAKKKGKATKAAAEDDGEEAAGEAEEVCEEAETADEGGDGTPDEFADSPDLPEWINSDEEATSPPSVAPSYMELAEEETKKKPTAKGKAKGKAKAKAEGKPKSKAKAKAQVKKAATKKRPAKKAVEEEGEDECDLFGDDDQEPNEEAEEVPKKKKKTKGKKNQDQDSPSEVPPKKKVQADAMETKEKDTPDKTEYDYLLNMNLWSLTYEKVEEIKKQLEAKKEELEILKSTTIETMWDRDLEALCSSLDELDRQEDEELIAAANATEGRKLATKGKGRGRGRGKAVEEKEKAKRESCWPLRLR